MVTRNKEEKNSKPSTNFHENSWKGARIKKEQPWRMQIWMKSKGTAG